MVLRAIQETLYSCAPPPHRADRDFESVRRDIENVVALLIKGRPRFGQTVHVSTTATNIIGRGGQSTLLIFVM